MCQVRNYPIFWQMVIYGQSLPRYPHTVSESKSLCGYLGKLFALYDRFPKNWVVVCTQQKNTFCQFRLPSNHQTCDLAISSYQAWCAKSETTQFFWNRSYTAKVCPDIRIQFKRGNPYADIWANFGFIWPIPKKLGSFGLGTSWPITWATQVSYLMVKRQSKLAKCVFLLCAHST